MKLFKSHSKKNSAQAMVEFAIALPLLLMLLYGILETGRLLFLYSTVVTASRQAARYASSTGVGSDGSTPRYQDCTGIKAAANKAGYLGTFDTITLKYDGGPSTAATTYCASGAKDPSLTYNILKGNQHRIVVTVAEPFVPIVPKLVPFIARTITATSARTILVSIDIPVTAVPIFSGSTPTPSNTPTITPSETSTPTNTSTNSPTPIFSPTKTLTPTITLTPSKTPTPTNTPTNTPTFTPSNTPTPSSTPISNCNQVAHGPLSISGNSMSMTITNSTSVNLVLGDLTIYWYHDNGHTSGANKTLRLREVDLNSTAIWTGSIYAPSYTISTSTTLGPGTTTLTFTFDQTYDRTNGTERIYINLGTNGCQSWPIDSSN